MEIDIFKFRLRMIKNRFTELNLSLKEWYSINKWSKENRKAYLERAILVHSHSIERSMGFRSSGPGHSYDEAVLLLKKISLWTEKYDVDMECVKIGISAIYAYLDYQEQFNYTSPELEEFKNVFSEFIKSRFGDKSLELPPTGVIDVGKSKLINSKNYADVITSRHSIRQFSDTLIDEDILLKCFDMANQSPSACNRQPCRIYYTISDAGINLINKHFPSNKTFRDEFKGYIILTSRRNLFFGTEMFQWYINGGIYLANLVNALHYNNIGSCIMQWRAHNPVESKMKQELNIPNNEAIISIIGIGNYDNDTRILIANRLNSAMTTKRIL